MRKRRTAICAAVVGVGLGLAGWPAHPQAAAEPGAPVGPATTSPAAPYFDTSDPAIGNLDPALLQAITNAAAQAVREGITMTITSGWRTREEQLWLFDDAVQTYGSGELARQYVQSPEVSHHVTGKAVDVAPAEAGYWLIRNGRQFGLCQIYANEIWHFELAVDAYGNCPPLRPNAAF